MWPMIWADLNAGEAAKKEVKNLDEQLRAERGKQRADSIAGRGRAIDCATCQRQLPEAKEQALAGYRAATESDRRYRKANTERWVWRGLAAVAAYFGIRSL